MAKSVSVVTVFTAVLLPLLLSMLLFVSVFILDVVLVYTVSRALDVRSALRAPSKAHHVPAHSVSPNFTLFSVVALVYKLRLLCSSGRLPSGPAAAPP